MDKSTPFPRRLTLLHADTPLKTALSDLPLDDPALSLRLPSLPWRDGFRVLSAIWSRTGRSDAECRDDLFRIAASFRTKCDLAGIPRDRVPLSVEDLRLIGEDLSLLDAFAQAGVISVAPFWRGENALGGAWDTDVGLTDFGRRAIARCFDLGIVPDVSHASRKATDEIISLGETRRRPVIASHVGFDGLAPHGRNLTDRDANRIADLGGLVGVTFHAPHLTKTGRATVRDAASHILYGYRLIPRAIALGSDFDGTDELPDGLNSSDDLPSLAASLYDAGMDGDGIDAVFFRNADRFFNRFDFPHTKG